MSPADHLSPGTMTTLERAIKFVEEFQGDPRCALNCMHAEALLAEVKRLRAMAERQTQIEALRPKIEKHLAGVFGNDTWASGIDQRGTVWETLRALLKVLREEGL